jgi:hypothetical protein
MSFDSRLFWLISYILVVGYFMFHQFLNQTNTLVCFYDHQNKQPIFGFTELTDWSLQPGLKVFSARYDPNL